MITRRPTRRVLVVDDAEFDHEMIRRMLANDVWANNEVSSATSIAEGVELAQASRYDLAFVDWSLPDGNGPDFGEQLRERGIVLPFVLITGQERPGKLSEGFEGGAVDIVTKSDLSSHLLARVCENAMVRARLARQLGEARQAEETAIQLEREARRAAEAALRDQANMVHRISRLHLLSSLFNAAYTSEDVTRALCAHAAIFGATTGIATYIVRDRQLHLQHQRGMDDQECEAILSLDAQNLVSETARLAEPVQVASEAELQLRYGTLSPRPLQSWLSVPLCNDAEVLGVILLRFPQEERPAYDQRDFIHLVADLVAQAVVRARLYEEATRRAEFERRLLAIVGHDLRTPLSAVLTGVQRMQKHHPDDAVLPRIERSARAMTQLIEDIMVRSESGLTSSSQGELPREVDLAEVIGEAIDELRTAFPTLGIAVDGRGPILASVNVTRVRQVLANLVRNAAQYGTQERPITVRFAANEQLAELSVHNEGTPIPEDVLPKLFDPFQRGSGARGRGAGLGLFIVHELVTAMGGTVRVDSGPLGTTFAVTVRRNLGAQLPRASASAGGVDVVQKADAQDGSACRGHTTTSSQ